MTYAVDYGQGLFHCDTVPDFRTTERSSTVCNDSLPTCIVSLTQHVSDGCVAGVGGEYELLGKVRIDQDRCVCESGLQLLKGSFTEQLVST